MGLHANAAVVLQSTEVQEHDGGLGGQRGALRGRITLSKRRVRLLKTQLSVIRKHPEHPPTRIHLSDWRVGCVSPPHREGDVVGRTEKGMSSAVNAPPDAVSLQPRDGVQDPSFFLALCRWVSRENWQCRSLALRSQV